MQTFFVHNNMQRPIIDLNGRVLISPSPLASEEAWEDYRTKKAEFNKLFETKEQPTT